MRDLERVLPQRSRSHIKNLLTAMAAEDQVHTDASVGRGAKWYIGAEEK